MYSIYFNITIILYYPFVYVSYKLIISTYLCRNITKILLTNDLTEDVALEAKEQNCEMIISYHPPIFAPIKSVVQKLV